MAGSLDPLKSGTAASTIAQDVSVPSAVHAPVSLNSGKLVKVWCWGAAGRCCLGSTAATAWQLVRLEGWRGQVVISAPAATVCCLLPMVNGRACCRLPSISINSRSRQGTLNNSGETCLNICTCFIFLLPKNKSVREQMIPVRGVGGWTTEPWTPSQHRCVAPPEKTPSVGPILAACLGLAVVKS